MPHPRTSSVLRRSALDRLLLALAASLALWGAVLWAIAG